MSGSKQFLQNKYTAKPAPFWKREGDFSGESDYIETPEDSMRLDAARQATASQQANTAKFIQTGNVAYNNPDLIQDNSGAQAAGGLQAASQIAGAAGAGDPLGGTLSGAAAGAGAGAMIGNAPGAAIGAGVGAGVGLVGGLAKSRAEKRRRQAEANQKAYQEISATHQKTAQQQNMNIGNIMAALKAAFGG